MIAEYTYRFRLYPNKEQEHFLNIQFGHCRFVYN
ncbi:helix-turn-helix domain-containing protein, partial [Persephonella hydrogeniphila]